MKGMVLLICVQLAVVSSLSCRDWGKARGHANTVTSVAFSPDGKTLVSGSWDGSIKFWDVATGNETATFHAKNGGVLCVAFAPHGKIVASGNRVSTIEIADAATPKNAVTLDLDNDTAMSVAFSPDGKTLAAGMYRRGSGETVESSHQEDHRLA